MEEQVPERVDFIDVDPSDHSENDTVNDMAKKAFDSVGPAAGTSSSMLASL